MEEITDEEVLARLKYLRDECFWRYEGCNIRKSETDLRIAADCLQRTIGRLAVNTSPVPLSSPESVRSTLSQDNDNEETCAICLSSGASRPKVSLPCDCNAQFHFGCIRKWIEKHTTCPCCRQKVLSIPVQSESDTALIESLWMKKKNHDLATGLSQFYSRQAKTPNIRLHPATNGRQRLSKPDRLRALVTESRRKSSLGNKRGHIGLTPISS